MSTSERVGQRIKELRKINKLTQLQVAEYLGIARESISQWETEGPNKKVTSPNGENAFRLAKLFNVPFEYIMYGEEATVGSNKPDVENSESYLTAMIINDNGNTGRTTYIPSFIAKTADAHPSMIKCFEHSGDSMSNILPDGSFAFANTVKTKITDGKMYLIEQEGLFRVRLLLKMPGGAIRIIAYNAENYPDEIVIKEECNQLKVIGQVFYAMSPR